MPSIKYSDLVKTKCSFAPSQIQALHFPNKRVRQVADFLKRPLTVSDRGYEPGSHNYISDSTHFLIKAKALQENSFVPIIEKDTVSPIRPQVFKQYHLQAGDLVISKDSNIGEAVILDRDYPNHTLAGALYKLPVKEHKYYLFACMKHRVFREQLDLLVPKGATIRHAKQLFLNCKIPMPQQKNSNHVIAYVEALTRQIIQKEIAIRARNACILSRIDTELRSSAQAQKYRFQQPKYSDIIRNNRVDAGLYCDEFQYVDFLIRNYSHGWDMLDKQGFSFIAGPSLEIKLLITRIDSTEEKPGFYRLITPTQITNYGTVEYYKYMGTSYVVPPLQKGDIIFGESGTGRSFVYLEDHKNTITNAHGHVLRPAGCTLEKAIAVRCILAYLKHVGHIDYLTVGGAGGHLSQAYFNRIAIPNFPGDVQDELTGLYYTPNITYDLAACRTIAEFEKIDNAFNQTAGIIQLDQSMKYLKNKLNRIIDKIAADESVAIEF